MLSFGVSLADQISGPAKDAKASLSSLGEMLESMASPAGLAAVALGLVTIATVAVTGALYEGAGIALEASEAYGKLADQLGALAGGEAGGGEIVANLDALSRKLPETRAQLGEWAKTLLASGVHVDELDEKLTSMAGAQALMGDSGVAAFEKLSKKIQLASESGQGLKIPLKGLGSLYDMGLKVADVAAKMGISEAQLTAQMKAGTVDAAKFGYALDDALDDKAAEALAGQLESLPTQIAKAKANFTELFEGVDTSGFLHALTSITGMFDQSSTSGQVLKWVVTTIFNSLFSLGQKVLPYVHLFLLKLINAGLRMYIIFKPVIKHFKDLWDQIDAGGDSISLMDIFVETLVGGAMMAAAMAESVATLVGWVIGLTDAVSAAYTAITDWLSGIVKSVKEFFNGDQGSSMGGSLVDGLVSGITANAGKVIAAMTDLAKSALGSAKKTLGISSPSKAMIEMGGFMGEGMAIGVSGAANDVEAAVGGVATQAMAAVPAGGGAATGGGGGVTVNIEAGAIVINGAGSASELTEQAAALMFERIALSQGLGNAA